MDMVGLRMRRPLAGVSARCERWRRLGARLAHSGAPTASRPCVQPLVRHVAGLSRARVREVEYLAADVKQFTIEVTGEFSHQPGQWTDVFMPDIDAVGGYSIASAPSQLSQAGTITLAIKAAQHAPTEWMHRRATAGTELLLRPGGSFVYEPPVHGRAVLLVRHACGPSVHSATSCRGGAAGLRCCCGHAAVGHVARARQHAAESSGTFPTPRQHRPPAFTAHRALIGCGRHRHHSHFKHDAPCYRVGAYPQSDACIFSQVEDRATALRRSCIANSRLYALGCG